eukprot:GGOE01018085.1.p1 GENE.GGOE01018085.1~~GGOE01018085.1.p1  ORF type:complete len:502 (+),score=132.43 GGOE01018085.1:62-1567(+)
MGNRCQGSDTPIDEGATPPSRPPANEVGATATSSAATSSLQQAVPPEEAPARGVDMNEADTPGGEPAASNDDTEETDTEEGEEEEGEQDGEEEEEEEETGEQAGSDDGHGAEGGTEADQSRTERLMHLLGKLAKCQQVLSELDIQEEVREAAAEHLRQIEQLLLFSHDVRYAGSINPRDLEQELDRFSQNLTVVIQWPKSPLPIPDAPPCGTRSYFEHPNEGRIKLVWANPLPLPGFSSPAYECDVCLKECKAAWQHVTLGDERDASTFIANRIGWDVCFPCFEEYRTRELALLIRAAKEACEVETKDRQQAVMRSQLYQRHEIKVTNISPSGGALTVHLRAPATGEFLLCTAALAPQLPDCWNHACIESLYSMEQFHGEEAPSCSICLDSVLDTTEGRIRPVRTKCGHFFHDLCLRKHFRGVEGVAGCRRCPLCRQADPLDLQSNPDVQLPLEFSLQTDCRGAPFLPGTQYLVACIMAADKDQPVESYSSATFQAVSCPL